MDFFDVNCSFGLPAAPGGAIAPCPTLEDLATAHRRAGIGKALVWHMAQHDVAPQRGNAMLSEAIAGREDYVGCWTLLPGQTGEIDPETLFERMRAERIVALRAFPYAHRWLLNRLTMGPVLDAMSDRRIPLLLSVRRMGARVGPAQAWGDIHALMTEFPDLTLIVCDHGSWGCDRYFRPLFDAFERVRVDTSLYYIDGGIESVVERYGPGRIVYGSGLPDRYPGGMMLAIAHAQISDDAKVAIAGGTARRLIEEVRL